MARKDKPYLPLYIQDFMTDEKLIECSAATTGVYIKIMCILHKCDIYGKILLKEKYKQSESKVLNFATMLKKHLPFDLPVIEDALKELLDEKVMHIEGDYLCQKRMMHDGDVSEKRSESGSEGGKSTQNKLKNFAKGKSKANTDIDNDIEIDNKPDLKKEKNAEKKTEKTFVSISATGFNQFPTPADFNGLPEIHLQNAKQQLFILKQQDVPPDKIIGMWEVFKNLNLTGTKFHPDKEDVYRYFGNWIVTKKFENGNNKNEAGNPGKKILFDKP